MKNLIKIELKKSIFSKTFLLGAALLSLFAVLSAVYSIESWSGYNPDYLYKYCMENGKYISNPDFPLYSFFGAWLGGDTLSLAYTLFFTFLPIGASIPYAWSFHSEKKNGYIRNIAIRTNKINYYIAKGISVFISGALAVFIPYIINILLVSTFIPYYPNWAGYNFYNLVFFGNMWSDLFFSNPILHTMLFVMLNTLYGGIFALLSFAVSFYVKNIIAIIFGPFLFMIISGYVESIVVNQFFQNSLTVFEFVPTHFLHSRAIYNQVNGTYVLLITLILLSFSILTIIIKGKRNEIY